MAEHRGHAVAEIHPVALPTSLTACHIYPIADLHVGDRAFRRKKLEAYLKYIQDNPHTYIILVGDLCNVAIMDSVSDTYEEEYFLERQQAVVRELFWPVRDRILGITGGNHEYRVSKKVGLDVTKQIAADLGVYYGPDELYLKISLGKKKLNHKRVVYAVYVTHGTGGGRTMGGKANNLARLSEVCDADVYIQAHTHQILTFPTVHYKMDLKNNVVLEHKKVFVSTGGYLGRSRYAVRQVYPPQKVGSPRIRLDGTRKDAHVSI